MIGHTTAHEVKFVRELCNPTALRGYIAAAARRTSWDGLDKDIILTAATRRLADLLARRSART